MSVLLGQVHNGVVVLEGGASLPDGTTVRVEPIEREDQPTTPAASPLAAALLKHAGKAQGLPEDLAAQHDHYLHGTPKR